MNVVMQYRGQAVMLEDDDLPGLLWMRDEFIPKRDDLRQVERDIMLRDVGLMIALVDWDRRLQKKRR